ncbi:MAG: decaprenyl-phosphate phosphoribosyltransferase [Phormidesmis sp.]
MRIADRSYGGLGPYVIALRPHQWTKNIIVFAASLFSFSITTSAIVGSLLAFVLFCSLSSSFYLLNDIVDVKADRLHPVKRKRPIASGLVNLSVAIAMAVILLSTSLTVGFLYKPMLGAILALYACLQVAYNFKLKQVVIADVILIAIGFVLRAYAGAAAANVVVSSWFVLCTAMLALFLATEKRKAELRTLATTKRKTRAVLQRYSLSLLSRMESVVVTGSIMCYVLWSSGPILNGASTSWMMLTIPFVLYGIFRYQLLSDPAEMRRRAQRTGESNAQTENPSEVLLKDIPILMTVISWSVTVCLILFLEQRGIIS